MGAQCHENHAENSLKRTQQTSNSAQLPSLWEILSGLCARSASFPAVFAQNWVAPAVHLSAQRNPPGQHCRESATIETNVPARILTL